MSQIALEIGAAVAGASTVGTFTGLMAFSFWWDWNEARKKRKGKL